MKIARLDVKHCIQKIIRLQNSVKTIFTRAGCMPFHSTSFLCVNLLLLFTVVNWFTKNNVKLHKVQQLVYWFHEFLISRSIRGIIEVTLLIIVSSVDTFQKSNQITSELRNTHAKWANTSLSSLIKLNELNSSLTRLIQAQWA